MSDPLLDLDYQPHLPPKTDYGIGIVGCGGIVNYAALPTYRKHNLNVVACYDVRTESAERTAQEFNIPKVYRALDALLDDKAVEIVEISVPPWVQLDIARRVHRRRQASCCARSRYRTNWLRPRRSSGWPARRASSWR